MSNSGNVKLALNQKTLSLHYVAVCDRYNIRVLGAYGCDFDFPMFALTEQEARKTIREHFLNYTIIDYNEFLEESRKQ